MLEEIQSINVNIADLVKRHGQNNSCPKKMEENLESLKTQIENFENEQMYLLWMDEIKDLRF